MYNYLLILILPLAVFMTAGCEKVIDVDLNDTDPEVVIEGNLSLESGNLEVKISKTGSYFDTAPLEKIDNARVFLVGGPGYNAEAEKKGEGLYTIQNLPLQTGFTYQLNVQIDGEEYSAFSTLNPKVKIDSLGYEYQSEDRFIDGGYRLLLYFNDPPDKENYYRVKMYRNNRLLTGSGDLIIFDDSRLDGKGIRVKLRAQNYTSGDTAKVELLSIDKNVWEYFTGLREINNLNPGSPAPANPVSNLSNGALGYFSAWAGSSREIVIP